jgi:putative nucleotidyltransferase with HDIG domain
MLAFVGHNGGVIYAESILQCCGIVIGITPIALVQKLILSVFRPMREIVGGLKWDLPQRARVFIKRFKTMSIETALYTNERVSRLVGSLEDIATLPEVTAQIIATVNSPHSTAAELHRIIAHDPSLVSRILKVVNSSFYRRRNEIDSVERAIVLLGFDAVHNIAVSASVGAIFTHENLCDDFTARDLWTHSVAVAAAARAMARQISAPLADAAFLAGIVHDVGLLVELQVCKQKLKQVCQGAQRSIAPFSTLEYEAIGCNHEELGAALAHKWGFPDFCRAAAAYHHHPSLADAANQQIAAIIYAADTLCCHDAIGFNLTAVDQIAETVAFEGIIPMEVIENAREELPQLVSDAILAFN